MKINRSHDRVVVDIPIVITTVLESLEGTIIDLSEGGAQVVGCSLPPLSQCQVDLDGDVVFGAVRWSEIDRMGIRFLFPIHEGPLFDHLRTARIMQRAPVAYQTRTAAQPRLMVAGAGFGRRRA
ncbi:hypothetical protein GGR44_003044 [Sphingobium fontiphilum]|uniref:PilZ domain-containing protein n=1 Tax=Sphingobium fontiphilum TaxID=944425 RepID=A0A7W6GPH2_9SPHN|nr:PilZ domain-containing protein [Sphingobium fontiphilum]MBB3983356.1 hypothetical protein [Sphingobium fontiphilum]